MAATDATTSSVVPPPAPMLPPLSPKNPIEEEKVNLNQALQIVGVNAEGNKFELNEALLTAVLTNVPEGMQVVMVSVVGAFRTGKSFLLDLFLRYLSHHDQSTTSSSSSKSSSSIPDWLYTCVKTGKAATTLEGNSNMEEASSDEGFSWRAGKERNTTGIWVWGTPFLRKLPGSNETVAVFLLDTQGMFDSETSQMLTASIFGLSTLISSYQIYNVDKHVQEDHLQHLALFTEYGRLALDGSSSTVEEDTLQDQDNKDNDAKEKETSPTTTTTSRPFQHLEFLVRDWQNFEDEEDTEAMLGEMKEYLTQILSTKKQQDLADTREQINACFDEFSCFLLPHPGLEVTKKSYDGAVSKIRTEFVSLLNLYVEKIFNEQLVPKKIHGRPVTAVELLNFIKVYVDLFKEASIFPEAKTLLEATAEANNVNSKQRAIDKYKKEMGAVVGVGKEYVGESVLESHHVVCFDAATSVFDSCATMGLRSHIIMFREMLVDALEEEYVRFQELNREKNPFKNFGKFLLPFFGMVIFYVIRVSQDLFCSESYGYDLPVYDCKAVSVNLTHICQAFGFYIVIIGILHGKASYDRIQHYVDVAKVLVKNASAEKQKSE